MFEFFFFFFCRPGLHGVPGFLVPGSAVGPSPSLPPIAGEMTMGCSDWMWFFLFLFTCIYVEMRYLRFFLIFIF